ncbi:MAG: ATP-dependent RNA helicase HrpA [Mariprofundaceae bacterium]|nr:ATP-dependent RNA helicase HrpA [Mariprofundaceae bacterium]
MSKEQDQINQLFKQLNDCMLVDRRGFKKHLHSLSARFKQDKPVDHGLADIEARMQHSLAQRLDRANHLPKVSYPEDLPISAKRAQISAAIAKHQVVIIAGETGSGKTTQIPKICLELGLGIAGKIAHTQPRRIAARSVANRIADELNSTLGAAVGYKVRFSDKTSAKSYIKLMTDGILLAEVQSDPRLEQYDTIIIDEAHERSLNIDFLLGYLKQLLPRRPDLKVIVTSATINTEAFSRFFDDAPVIEVSGRNYPVDILYHPLHGDENEQERELSHAIVDAVDETGRINPLGDVLVFLPGEREIREALNALQRHDMKATEVVPLFSRLSPAEQDKVFQSHTGRRIVLATNVAETSLTVPGIKFVVDSGLARISRYSAKTKVQRLPIEAISQASANQRSGRCGRISAGICIRLYDKDSFAQRSEHTDPEIRRTNLASVILQMTNLGLGDVSAFPFMNPPENRAVADGYRLLHELQAIKDNKQLSEVGRTLVRLPVDPRMGRMLLQAQKESCLAEVAVIVAGLSVQDPRSRPLDAQQKADEKQSIFKDKESDFMAYLKLWNWYDEQSKLISRNQLRKLCQRHYLSYMRMREWHDLYAQILGVMRDFKMVPKKEPATSDQIHRSLLAGLLSHIGVLDEEKRYLGAHNLKFSPFPGSSLYKKPPKWLVAAELVETSKLFARTIAKIDPAWLEDLAPHLLKRAYSEPHWSAKRAQVAAYEKVSLFGLAIIGQRRVHYGSMEPELGRELFIRHALVYGEYHTHARFFKHNQALKAEVEALEAKSRRHDLMADEEDLFAFFDAKIPKEIFSGKLFEQWRKKVEKRQAKTLFFTRDMLLQSSHTGVDLQAFPDVYQHGELKLQYQYHFDPSQKADGITLKVPEVALGQLQASHFDGLVKGMLQEKLTCLIKTLPKPIRKQLAPAIRFSQAFMEIPYDTRDDLLVCFSTMLQRMVGVTISRDDWRVEELPAHLKMKFCVLDKQGKTLREGDDLNLLQQSSGAQKQVTTQKIERQGITAWDFGDLSLVLTEQRQGLSLQCFPALVDQGQSVAIQFFDQQHQADSAMQAGLRRLFMLALNQQVKFLKKNMPHLKAMSVQFSSLGTAEQLKNTLLEAAFDRTFMALPWPRTEQAFQQRLEHGRAQIVTEANKVAETIKALLEAHQHLRSELAKTSSKRPLITQAIEQQLSELLTDDFICSTPSAWLVHMPRFLKGAEIRLQKSARNPSKDQANEKAVMQLWQRYQQRKKDMLQANVVSPALEQFRWHIEELRISLFAQELKTSVPVSVARLEKAWVKVCG